MRYSLTLAVLATVLVAALPAGAATNTKITIEPNAQINLSSTIVEVGVHYQCVGGIGSLAVFVTQGPPEHAFSSTGGTGKSVTCDGKTREASVGVFGNAGWDAGNAEARALLFPPTGDRVEDERTINIVVT